MTDIPSLSAGTIIMFPLPLGSNSIHEMQHPVFNHAASTIQIWVAENARTLRRFLSSLQLGIKIDELIIFELIRDYKLELLHNFLNEQKNKGPIGMASEAGIPGMADPGQEVAHWAHRNKLKVISITGPSSVFLALSASGLNGQHFMFHGYPPIKDHELVQFMNRLNHELQHNDYTQIMIETPYRADRLMKFLCTHIKENHHLCLAVNLHDDTSSIRTLTIKDWKNNIPEIGKQPCVFLIGR
jgi:16S rRNA (cytidine1402-2'-O)-methyltransferase